jgi:hypothetical protein
MSDEYEFDLFWHALNYRTASVTEADAMWKELEACVRRLKARRAERAAERCAEFIEQRLGPDGAEMAREVRAWNGRVQ